MAEFTKAQPQKEHEWLQKLVGEWRWTHDALEEPGKSTEKYQGTETVRSIDGIWFVAESRGGASDGTTSTSIMTLGYDPAKQRYIGTFVASMMTALWIYEGEIDAAKNALVLDTEGPSFADQTKIAKYKDTIRFENDDHRVLTSAYQTDDGQWNEFMTAHYRRKR